MALSDFGIKLGAEGEKEFRAALRDINQTFKVLGSEMTLVASQFDKTDKSEAALAARQGVLTKEIETQKTKIETLRSALENASDSFGENDKRTQNWQIQLNKAQAELNNLDRELRTNGGALKENTRQTDDNRTSLQKFVDYTKQGENAASRLGSSVKGTGSAFRDVGGAVKETAAHVKDGVKEFASDTIEKGKAKWQGFKDTVHALSNPLNLVGAGFETLNGKLHGLADGMNKDEKSVDSLGNEMVDTAKSADKLGDAVKSSSKEASDGESKWSKLGSTLKTVGAAVATAAAAVGTAATAVGVGMFKMAESAAATGKEVNNTSQKLGLSREGFQEWEYILKKSGTSIDVMGIGMKGLQKTMAGLESGSKGAVAAFDAVGLSANDLKDKTPEQALELTIKALQDMPAGADRTAAALKLFGKGAMELQPLLNKTSAETEELRQRAHDLGLVMSDEQVDAAGKFNSAMGKMKDTISGFKMQMSNALLPSFADGISAFMDFAQGAEGGEEKLNAAINSIVKEISTTLPKMVDKIAGVIPRIADALGKALPGIVNAIADILPKVISTVIGVIPPLMKAIVGALPSVIKAILQILPMLANAAVQIITALIDGLSSMLPELIPVAVSAIMELVSGLIQNLQPLLGAALQLILALADGILAALPELISALPVIIQALVDFLIAAIPQIIDAGIQLLVSLVDALPTIIEAIVAAIPLIIDGVLTAVLGAIPMLIAAGIKLLVSLVENLPTIILTIVKAIPKIISSLTKTLAEHIPDIINAGVLLITSLITNLPKIIMEIVKALPEIIAAIVGGLLEGIGSLAGVGMDLIKGLWQGISDMAGWIGEKIKGFGKSVLGGIKSFFGIASPSKVFRDQIGKNLALGIGDGFDRTMADVTKDMQKAIPSDFDIDAGVRGGIGDADGINTVQPPYSGITGPLFTIQSLIVRSDDDIRKISAQLYSNIAKGARAAGRAVII